MAGPCLCGDPECGRCFPGGRGRFLTADLADAVAAWMVASAQNGPAPDLSLLSPEDVAGLIELTNAAVRSKLAAGNRAILNTEQVLDSDLAQRVFDFIREYDIDAQVSGAEK